MTVPTRQEGKPVGTVHIAVDHPQRHLDHHTLFPAGRSDFKSRVVTLALFQVRKLLLEISK